MRGGELVEDAAGSIVRTVIDGDDLQIRIVDFHQGGERSGEFLFLVACGKENRDARTIGVGGGREIPDPREAEAP